MTKSLNIISILFFCFNALSSYSQNNCKVFEGASISDCYAGNEPQKVRLLCSGDEARLLMTSEAITPIPMCTGGNSLLNNPNYYSFVADGTAAFSILISPIPGSCNQVGGGVGIQAALVGPYDCTTTTPYSIPCQTACTTNPVFLETKFIPNAGDIIILVIDGCNGSACEVDINVLTGWSDTIEIPSDEELNEHVIEAEVNNNCRNQIFTLDPPIEGICNYRWSFPDGSTQDVNSHQITVDVRAFPDGLICVQGFAEECFPGELFPSENTICFNYIAKDYLDTQVGSESTTCGNSNGVAFVEAFGEAPFDYQWSNGVTDSFIVNVDAGLYLVTVTDGFGCERIDSVEIISSEEISSVVEKINPNCSGSFGIISLSATGGSGTFEYLWSPIVNTENFADSLPVGEYFITITDTSDPTCFQIISVELTLYDNLEMTIEEIHPSLALENTGFIIIEVNLDSEFNYVLELPDGTNESDTISGSSFEFTQLGIGIHQLIIEEIKSGCRDTLDFEIELVSSIFEGKIKNVDQISIFPNPVHDILYFDEEVIGYLFQMFSVEGKLMEAGVFEKNQLNLNDLGLGVYILILENAEGERKMAKVLKVE